MPDPVTGLIIGGTSIASSVVGSNAAKKAGNAQADAGYAAIAEQEAAREEMRRLLQPYVNAGEPALQGLLGMAGLAGEGSQAAAIQQQEESPLFQGLVRQGEDAILQNASATGDLRGGNVKGALAQFRPALLNDFFTQQFQRLAGITQLGQNAAAGVGTQGLGVANQIGQQFGNIGAARAGTALGQAQSWQNTLNLPAKFFGAQLGMGGF